MLTKKLPNVKKILEPSTIRRKYHEFEARRKLLASYDMFLCDSSLYLMLRSLLGKTFFKSKKYPIPIRINDNIGSAIATARDSTYLYVPSGTCINLKIATNAHSTKEIMENILFSIDCIVGRLPGKWNSVQTFNLKSSNSIALPFFQQIITKNDLQKEDNK